MDVEIVDDFEFSLIDQALSQASSHKPKAAPPPTNRFSQYARPLISNTNPSANQTVNNAFRTNTQPIQSPRNNSFTTTSSLNNASHLQNQQGFKPQTSVLNTSNHSVQSTSISTSNEIQTIARMNNSSNFRNLNTLGKPTQQVNPISKMSTPPPTRNDFSYVFVML